VRCSSVAKGDDALVIDPLPRRPPGSRDPRPLLGEPLALDLLNTHWLEEGRLQDLLATAQGTVIWLHSAAPALGPDVVPGPVDAVREALRSARDVVQDIAEHPDSQRARQAFNALLARGRRERRLTSDGPVTRVLVDDPAWTVPWLVGENYLDLLERAPDRIRRCEHPECVLWYFDSSRSGTRRWCSMSICGNRAKATRHYRRRTAGTPAD
jgi:predicted RNA-binding Zn ribbon-like protein